MVRFRAVLCLAVCCFLAVTALSGQRLPSTRSLRREPRRLASSAPSQEPEVAFAAGYYWVLALESLLQIGPSPPASRGSLPRALLEGHDQACSRVGLIPTTRFVALNGTVWSRQMLLALTAALDNHTSVPASTDASIGGCCVASAWCGRPNQTASGTANGSSGPLQHDAPLVCVTHAVGTSQYDNFGWLPGQAANSLLRPLFTCSRPPIPGEPGTEGASTVLADPPVVRKVFGTSPAVVFGQPQQFFPAANLSYRAEGAAALRMTLTVDGYRLGDDPNDVSVSVGGLECRNPQICHRFCQSCETQADCDSGKQCLTVGVAGGEARAVCVPACDSTERRCPCGGECYRVTSSSSTTTSFFICLNRDLATDSEICPSSALPEFRPAAGDGDSRIECDLPEGLCPAAGALDVVVADVSSSTARAASTGLLSGLLDGNTSVTATVAAGDAGPTGFAFTGTSGITLVTRQQQLQWPWGGGGRFLNDNGDAAAGLRQSSAEWRFQRDRAHDYSRPIPFASFDDGFCSTDRDCESAGSPALSGSNVGVDGFCFQAQCVLGCCLAVPTGRCESEPAASQTRDVVGELQYLPLPHTVAALLPAPARRVGDAAGDVLSSVSFVDDSPLDLINLTFAFPFYSDANVSALFLGANGFLQVHPEPPCNGFFANGDCSIASGYRGVIGALISDWDPSAWPDTTVYYRSGRHSLCASWARVREFNFEPEPNAPQWNVSVCVFRDGGIHLGLEHAPGPPNFTEWFSGIRALGESPTEAREGALAVAQGFQPQSEALGEVALSDETTVGLARTAITSGTQAGFCSVGTVGCLSPRCGPEGTVVTIRWAGIGCGLGLGLGEGGGRLLCVFGGTASNATLTRLPGATGDSPGQLITCTVPAGAVPTSANLTAAGDAGITIPVTVVAVLPNTMAAAEARLAQDLAQLSLPAGSWTTPSGRRGAGIRLPSSNHGELQPSLLGAGDVVFDILLNGVLNADNSTLPSASPTPSTTPSPAPSLLPSANASANATANATNTSRLLHALPPVHAGELPSGAGLRGEREPSKRLLLTEELGSGIIVSVHTLMFTVLPPASTRQCGCDVTPGSSCDSCGICNGGNLGRDCAGRCLGLARVDSCGVCSGGSTGQAADSSKDCNGICFGPGVNCPTPSPAIGLPSASPFPIPNPSDSPVSPSDETGFWVIIMLLMATVIMLLLVGGIFVKALARRREDELEEIQMAAIAEEGAAPAGLTEEQMGKLPSVPFHKADCEANEQRNAECIISMEEFDEGETVIRLPCEHQLTYHLGVQYFLQNTKCPLCRKDIAEWMTAKEAEAAAKEAKLGKESTHAALATGGAAPLEAASSIASASLAASTVPPSDSTPREAAIHPASPVTQPAQQHRLFGRGGNNRRIHPIAAPGVMPSGGVSFENPIRGGSSSNTGTAPDPIT